MNKLFSHNIQRFSIRKYSFGAASVLLGFFLISNAQSVKADEQSSETATTVTSVAKDINTSSDASEGGLSTVASIPERGNYTFTGHASIKAEPKVSAPEIAYYEAGNSVFYDKVLLSDGHYWISYVSYSGNRRYISITKFFEGNFYEKYNKNNHCFSNDYHCLDHRYGAIESQR